MIGLYKPVKGNGHTPSVQGAREGKTQRSRCGQGSEKGEPHGDKKILTSVQIPLQPGRVRLYTKQIAAHGYESHNITGSTNGSLVDPGPTAISDALRDDH